MEHILADRGARVRAAIGLRVEPLPTQEVIFDELEISVETQCLVVNVTLLGIRTDDDASTRNP